MTPLFLRLRACRQRKQAKGLCIDCQARASHGIRCFQHALEHANRKPWLLVVMGLAAENRCIVCKQPKDRFHPLQHRKCPVQNEAA